MNKNSPLSSIPRWAGKTIEAVGPKDDDVSSGRLNFSHKQFANVSLMYFVLETSDPVTYSNAQGQRKWAHAIKS
jgi:hypothetical protein